MTEPVRTTPSRLAGPDDLAWQPSYDRDSVDRYLAATESECLRLQSELRSAHERTDAARARVEAKMSEAQAGLGALVLDAQAEIAQLEEAHERVLAGIHTAAREEARRIVMAAQAEAAAIETEGSLRDPE